MKALRYLLIGAMISLTSVLSATNAAAQNLAQQPEAQMHSTSVMPSSGSTLPQAAIEGVTTTYSPSNTPSGPRRVGRDDNIGEVGEQTPIGDAPWVLIVLFGIMYVVNRKYMKRKKSAVILALLMISLNISAEGYETLANVAEVNSTSSSTSYTGDNGKTWTAVGATNVTTGGYRTLTVKATFSGNGLSGNLTTEQTSQGVGTISFYVKGMKSGTGYGNRTFRVSAGNKSVDVVVNIPSMTNSYKVDAQVDAAGASTIGITALPNSNDETATFGMYNITWTSFDGKTYKPTFSTNAEYVASGADTTYYTDDKITVLFASETPDAKFYYTIDGSTPTLSSTCSSSAAIPVGTYTVKAIAHTEAFGTSDVATKIYVVERGNVHILDGSNTALDGSFGTINSGTGESKSGLPFYSINKTKNNLITDAVVDPLGLSLYAYSMNNRDVTISYQEGTYVYNGAERTWSSSGEWTEITTLTNPNDHKLYRYEITLPNAIKEKIVRFKILSSGNTVYVDDITAIDKAYNQVSAPTFSHASGELASGTQVTVTPATGTTLHYTVNGAAEKTSTAAVNLTITEATNVEAYATQEGKAASWTTRVQYTVSGVVPEPVHPTSVVLDKTELSIVEGQTDKLTATVLPAEAEDKSVTWSSNNESVATVSQDGEIMALIPGEATITATTIDGGLTATCKVTVTKYIAPEPIHPSEVTLSRTSVTIQEGAIAYLTATVLPANAENKSVTWSTSDASVATVSEGTITAVKAGEATITVTTVDGGLTATCKVTVTKAPVYVTGVELNKTELVLEEGKSETLIATVIPSNADDKRVVWESDNTAAATVDENGLVAAIKKGEANITVTTVDGEHIAQCHVYVIEKDPTGVEDVESRVESKKIFREGQVLIIRNGEMYSITGARVP